MNLDLGIVTSCFRYGKYLDDWTDSILSLRRKPTAVGILTHGTEEDRQHGAYSASRLRAGGIPTTHEHVIEQLDFGTARNRAVGLVKTEWVMHFDADDTLMPHALDEIARLAPNADVVSLGYERNGDLAAGPRNRTKVYRTHQGPATLRDVTPSSGVSPFRRSFWERSPYRTDLIGGWDTALWIGFAKLNARFVPTKRPCFWYRQHADSVFNARRLSGWNAARAGAKLESIRRGDTGVSILVPRAGDGAARDRAWGWIRRRYAALYPDWQVIEGAGTRSQWCKGEAVSEALERATGDIVIVADADCILPEEALREAVERVKAGAPWVVPHTLVHRLTDEATHLAVGADPTSWPEYGNRLARGAYTGFPGGGFVVVPRSDFAASGGIPRQFVGWGAEDETLALILDTLLGPHERLRHDLVHLWHPPQYEQRGARYRVNRAIHSSYAAASGDAERIFALISGMPDRPQTIGDWLHRTRATRGHAMRDEILGRRGVTFTDQRTTTGGAFALRVLEKQQQAANARRDAAIARRATVEEFKAARRAKRGLPQTETAMRIPQIENKAVPERVDTPKRFSTASVEAEAAAAGLTLADFAGVETGPMGVSRAQVRERISAVA